MTASHGRAARALPDARSELDAVQDAAKKAREAEQEARRVHRVHQREVTELAERRERLAAEIEALEQRGKQLRAEAQPPAPPRPGGQRPR